MKKPISMRIDNEVLTKAKKVAKLQKKSFTQLVTDLLWECTKGHGLVDKKQGD